MNLLTKLTKDNKTNTVGLVIALFGVAKALGYDLSAFQEPAILILNALAVIFLRAGVKKSGPAQ